MTPSTSSRFKQIEISGTPSERGLSHGKQMKQEIVQVLPYYKNIFNLPDTEILRRAEHFRTVIGTFSKDYAQEIEGIAQGAEIEPLWIYALNARTEILALNTQVAPNECTSMCFPERFGEVPLNFHLDMPSVPVLHFLSLPNRINGSSSQE